MTSLLKENSAESAASYSSSSAQAMQIKPRSKLSCRVGKPLRTMDRPSDAANASCVLVNELIRVRSNPHLADKRSNDDEEHHGQQGAGEFPIDHTHPSVGEEVSLAASSP